MRVDFRQLRACCRTRAGQLCAMCGRLRVGKDFLHVAWSVQPCVRPICAVHMTAGHNALRGSGPGQQHAFEDAMALVGCPDRRIDLALHYVLSASQPLRHIEPWALSLRCERDGFIVVFVSGHHRPGQPGNNSRYALQKLCHPLVAVWAVHPGTLAAQMAPGPGNAHPLHGVAAGEFQFQPIARAKDPTKRRPAKPGLQHHALRATRTRSLRSS